VLPARGEYRLVRCRVGLGVPPVSSRRTEPGNQDQESPADHGLPTPARAFRAQAGNKGTASGKPTSVYELYVRGPQAGNRVAAAAPRLRDSPQTQRRATRRTPAQAQTGPARAQPPPRALTAPREAQPLRAKRAAAARGAAPRRAMTHQNTRSTTDGRAPARQAGLAVDVRPRSPPAGGPRLPMTDAPRSEWHEIRRFENGFDCLDRGRA
jgi:hypothetical protein